MTTRLTNPEERAKRILGPWIHESDIISEIRHALKELVEVAWERAPINSDTDTYIDIDLLEEIVNEILPDEEQIK